MNWDIAEGMSVYSSNDRKLGRIVGKGANDFVIEKGLFFPKDYSCSYSHIRDVRDDNVYLDLDADALEKGFGTGAGTGAYAGGQQTGFQERTAAGETRIPLAEEQLEARKVGHQAGEVRVRKDVVTEEKEISVPVRKEQVHVERVPASMREAKPGEATFEKSTTSVPIYEEEVEVTKRPVIKEELRVSRDARTEELRASDKVRRETADIERTDDRNRGLFNKDRAKDKPLAGPSRDPNDPYDPLK